MEPLRLHFLDGCFTYDGNTPENSPLGGSQSALVYLTQALAALGHDVHVYNHCPSAGIFDGVHYHPFGEIDIANKFTYADAFVSLRGPDVFEHWLNAGVRILWAQDAFDQPILKQLQTNAEVRQSIDSIFCISRWQAWSFMNYFHWPHDKIFVTRNAVCPDYFLNDFPEPSGHRLVYTSTPFRGLELLLKLFPKIYRSFPKAELHVFSSMKVYQWSAEEDKKRYGQIYKLADQPGVILHRSIGQKDLALELCKSRIFAYPNTYPETGCIAAMEALAAGCAAVTSRLAVLPETIGPDGFFVSGIPGSREYNEKFVDYCIRLLTDDNLWRELAMSGRKRILSHFTWDRVALEWADQICKMLQNVREKVNNLEGYRPHGYPEQHMDWE